MQVETLELQSEKNRKRLVEIVYKAKAGHIGGDLSCLNVLTALYFDIMRVWPDKPKETKRDRFVMSKGHCVEALYVTLEAKGFISHEITDTLGEFGSILSGHPTIEVPGIEVNTGALGHGLSVGVGMAIAAKMDKADYKTYVLMGDGEQGEGSIYEAAMAGNQYKLDNLVAIIDRNRLQISGTTEEVMSLESMRDRWTAFGWDVLEMNGDEMEDIIRTFHSIDYTNKKPHLLISHTTKGKGVSYMEGIAKWHHGVPTAEQYEEAVREISERIEKQKKKTMANNIIACRKSFTDTLLELARQDKDIVAVTTDARGSVTLGDFAKELPAQFVECGIAEQDAVGISAGLSHSGKKVFVCGPACFYVARSLEQVKVDLAYSQNNVKILGVSGGVAYGALGATHHSLHDIAVLRTFPGMNIVLPCDARQTRKLVKLLVDYPEPVYVRVGRAAVPDVYENDDFDFVLGKANMLLDGTDLTIIAAGETVYHAYQAGLMLQEKGIKARVLDMSSIKPVDVEAIKKAAEETGRIITVEEHSQFGGLGAIVVETLSENPVPVRIIGIPDENVVHGNSHEIFAHYGLDKEGICKAALEFMKK